MKMNHNESELINRPKIVAVVGVKVWGRSNSTFTPTGFVPDHHWYKCYIKSYSRQSRGSRCFGSSTQVPEGHKLYHIVIWSSIYSGTDRTDRTDIGEIQ